MQTTVTINPQAADFLSGQSGNVRGKRRAALRDWWYDLRLRKTQRQLMKLAPQVPTRSVLVTAIYQPGVPGLLKPTIERLTNTHHNVEVATKPAEQYGKFENLNLLLGSYTISDFDWLFIVDDDVLVPEHFLTNFIFLAEHFGLKMAQPAHCFNSNAAWQVTRRQQRSLLRETQFVEIGPITALHADTFPILLPFPPLRMGWGLDAYWSTVAQTHHFRQGIIDALPIHHNIRSVADTYASANAIEEGEEFLAHRPYLKRAQLEKTLVKHRTL